MHILLLFSILLTVTSSLFLTLIFENKRFYVGSCFFAAILFAQVVLTYEILSIFSAINPLNVLFINLFLFIISFICWKNFDKKLYFIVEIIVECNKFKFAIKNDKRLKYSVVAFLLCLIGSLIFMYFMPVNDEDAFSYHLARLPFWYEAGNLNHFNCADVRALIMPINSEIFYFWAYSFIKTDIFARLFSFLSFLIFVIALRGFLKEINVSFRLSLWVILSVSAMQSVMFSIAGAETNITISALVLAALYLFTYAVKNNALIAVFFASLLYALAIGTKTPALQVAPSLLISVVISYIYKKQDFYKPLLMCSVFIFVNFIFFASYNYVLNYFDFGNPLSSKYAIELHSFFGGFKGFVANLIRYFAMLIDFSGVPFGVEIWRIKTAIVNLILALLMIDPDIGTITGDTSYFNLGNNFDNMSGLGILGLLLFIPALIVALKRKKQSNKSLILKVIAWGFIINLIFLAFSLGYMIFSIRFIMFFVMFASPVLIYAFLLKRKNGFKNLITFIIIYSFTFSYYFYERRFSPYLMYVFYKNPSVQKFKEKIVCANIDFDTDSQACKLIKYVQSDKPVNVLYFAPSGINVYFPKHSENENLKIDFRLLETTNEDDIDWQSYDYIVVPNIQQNTNIKDILKYKNAVIAYNDDKNNGEIFYDFSPELFANCVFVSNRIENFKWLKEDEGKITASLCYYKKEIFEKHGFSLVQKFDTYDRVPDNQLNVYKNMNK